MTERRAVRLFLAVALTLWGCGERPTGPVRSATSLRVLPVFRQTAGDLPIIDVDELRVRVSDESGELLLADESVPVSPSDSEVEAEVRVDATPGDLLVIEVSLRSGGIDVYAGGPVAVSPGDAPVEVEVDYVGRQACLGTVGSASIGPVGGAPGVVTGRLDLGDCYESGANSFADRWLVDLPRDAGMDIEAVPTGGQTGLDLRIETIDGTTVAAPDAAAFEVRLPAGFYVVVVTADAPLDTGPYELSLSEFDRCDRETGTLSPGASFSQALTSIDCPLSVGSAADLWSLEVSTPTPYRIDLRSTAFDARLVLTDDDVVDPFLVQPIEEDDDHGLQTDALIAGVLAPARYRAWATTFSPGEVGAYQISMKRLSTGAPALDVLAVRALGVGGPDGACGSAQAFLFEFGFEDGDGDLVAPGGVTLRLTGIPTGLQETKSLGWGEFYDHGGDALNPYAGYADFLTCETFGTSESAKLAEFFITDAEGHRSASISTTLTPVSGGSRSSGASMKSRAGGPTAPPVVRTRERAGGRR